jgi:hypothetical protein
MKTVIIAKSKSFRIESHGNGWAYTFSNLKTGKSFFFQDDAATDFEKEWQDLDSVFNGDDLPIERVLNEFWSEWVSLYGEPR